MTWVWAVRPTPASISCPPRRPCRSARRPPPAGSTRPRVQSAVVRSSTRMVRSTPPPVCSSMSAAPRTAGAARAIDARPVRCRRASLDEVVRLIRRAASRRYAMSRCPPPSSRSQWSAWRSSCRLRSSLTPSAAPISACVCASPGDAEAAHQDLAMPWRDDLEHRPDLATGLLIVEPTPRVLGIGIGDEVEQRAALLSDGRVEGRRDARRLTQRPHPVDGEAGSLGDRLGARRSRALVAQLLLRPLDRGEPAAGLRRDPDAPRGFDGILTARLIHHTAKVENFAPRR